MVLELLFNIALIVLSLYCLFYVNSSVEGSIYTDPLGPAFWPGLLLVLLAVLLFINVIQILRKMPAEKRNLDSIIRIDFRAILRSRLTWGILLMLMYAFCLPYTGFMLTSFVMGSLLSYILGEKRPAVLILFPLLAVSVIFVIFYKGMSIQLPRGTVPFLRNFSIGVETFLRNIGT